LYLDLYFYGKSYCYSADDEFAKKCLENAYLSMKQRQIGGDTLAHLLLMTTAAMWVSNW
jgi:hypothetical protein